MRQSISLSSISLNRSENGAVLPLLALILFSALTVLGLAIDSGNLFHSSMLLQKAVDAGALAGAKRIAVTGKRTQNANPVGFIQLVQRVTQSMMVNNLLIRRGLDKIGDNQNGDPLRYSINVDLAQDKVNIEALWTVDLYLLKYLPGYPDKKAVRAVSTAQVQPSIVSMVLDSSGSIICPADGGDCSCKPLCGATQVTKVDRLKDAVALFVTQFNTARDMFQLSYFSTGSTTAVNINTGGGFSLGQISNALVYYPVQGDTNQCAGLLESYLGTRPAVAAQKNRRNIAHVLISDGAPTAARFFFANPSALPPNNFFGQPFSGYDYYSWSVLHRDPADNDPTKPATRPLLPGASVLAKGGIVPYDWSYGDPPGAAYGHPTDDVTGAPYPESSAACSLKDPLSPAAAFQGCLNDFSFNTPASSAAPSRVWGAAVPFIDYRFQYYNCAIAMADFLRDDGGVVYTIGIGFPAPATAAADPYQQASDSESRKDYFFARLANDTAYRTMPQFPGEFRRYTNPAVASHLAEGIYQPLDNALNIEQAFDLLYDRVVRKIKTVQLVK